MKLFKSSTGKQQLSRTEALACTPIVTPAVETSSGENGEVLIEYPLVIKPMLQAIFKRFNKGQEEEIRKKLQLDAHGSRVWATIDGEKNVREIITAFSEATGITTREAELSVTAFLRELGKRGIIILR